MSNEALRAAYPRTYEIFTMRESGVGFREIGRRLGISHPAVRANYAKAKALLGQTTGKPECSTKALYAARRCRCGLLYPCNSCVPTVWQVASSRSGDASGLT